MGQMQRRNRWRKEAMGKARIKLICIDLRYPKDQVDHAPYIDDKFQQHRFMFKRASPSILCETWSDAPQNQLVQVVPVHIIDGVVQPEYNLSGVMPGPMFISQFGGFPRREPRGFVIKSR